VASAIQGPGLNWRDSDDFAAQSEAASPDLRGSCRPLMDQLLVCQITGLPLPPLHICRVAAIPAARRLPASRLLQYLI
jgi:hypothetical protein